MTNIGLTNFYFELIEVLLITTDNYIIYGNYIFMTFKFFPIVYISSRIISDYRYLVKLMEKS